MHGLSLLVFSILDSKFKIMFVMVAMIWRCCVLILRYIDIITVKGANYGCIIHDISKSEADFIS